MQRFRRTAVVTCVAALLFASCDSVVLAFNPNPSGPPTVDGLAIIQVPPAGGDIRGTAPQVRATYPKATGWPLTVPVVIEFSQSMNEASIFPTSATVNDAKVIVRVKGTTQALPAQYNFIGGGRLLVIRPAGLSAQNSQSYETVILPGVRDVDGVRYNVTTESILAEFTPDAVSTDVDGQILAVYPRDRQTEIPRETESIVIFTRAATASTLTASNLRLTDTAGAAVTTNITLPLTTLGQSDSRIVQLQPPTPLSGNTEYRLVVTAAITFGQTGHLQFNNRTPFAFFRTCAVPAATGVSVANPTTGFPDKINLNNFNILRVNVVVPADALVGDRAVARIYGGDRATAATNDIIFVERSANLTVAGVSTVSVDFSAALGTSDRPKFDDGSVILLVQMQRGSAQRAGVFLGGTNARFDLTPPTMVRFGPPSSVGPSGTANGANIVTDLVHLSLYGTASEPLSLAQLSVPAASGVPAQLFASSNDGSFIMNPLTLGMLAVPVPFAFEMTDLAGNPSAVSIAGLITQRGLYQGAFSGQITVVAYDEVTLLPIANATVIVDPAVPVIPADPNRVQSITDANGIAIINGPSSPTHSVTVVANGYGLVTLYDTAANYASLPLRPLAATASLRGNLTVQLAPNNTVIIGSNVFDDAGVLTVTTASVSPTAIPATQIAANRPQIVTAVGGSFEPSAVPAFSSVGCNMLGSNLISLAPPGAPVAVGAQASRNITLLPASGPLIGSLAQLPQEDFANATGLDTANLIGGRPTVRLTMSLRGFTSQTMFGVGFSVAGAGAIFTLNGSWSTALSAQLAPFLQIPWIVAEARDTGGRMSRFRALLNLATGSFVDATQPMAIPVITVPGTVSGPPDLAIADVTATAAFPGLLAMLEVQAKDAAQREWLVLKEDGDVVGGTDEVQFPAMPVGVIGLANGAWSIRATARTLLPDGTQFFGNLVLTESRRMEVGYAHSAVVTVTVQ